LPRGVDPDGPGPARAIGFDAFPLIQPADNAVRAGGTIVVFAGTYGERVSVTRASLVRLAGDVTITTGPVGGGDIRFSAPVQGTAGGESLTLNASGGDVAFGATVGAGAALGTLQVEAAQNLSFTGLVRVSRLVLTVANGVGSAAAPVQTTATQL